MTCQVLIVDDSFILRSAIKKVVKMAGIAPEAIYEAGNGEEALEQLDQHPIDVVLLDINMPVMNGEEFLEACKARPNPPECLVVIVSTESNEKRLLRMRLLGADSVLRKPFEPEELAHILNTKLGVKL